jgi:osmoprotectant transport system substrate-binding protein
VIRWSAILLALAIVGACGGDDGSADPPADDGMRIASFDFAESELLAELYSQVLESSGTPVVRLGPVGPREVVAPALELDRIDLVPEYLGTASGHFAAASTDVAGLAEAVAPRGLVVLQPAEAEDVNVFVMKTDAAEANGFTRLSDLVDFAPTATLGATVECPDRPLCLPGLRDTYGLTWADFQPQRSLLVTADALLSGEIDVGLMFSTSAELNTPRLIVLEDDRGLQPPENVVPIVRADALDRWQLTGSDPLAELSNRLTTEDLRVMNERVGDDEPIESVAHSWLVSVGLLAG